MNDFKAHKYGPTLEELLMGRKDTFVDGTDEADAPTLDASEAYSIEEVENLVDRYRPGDFEKITLHMGTLASLVKDYRHFRDLIGRIYGLLEI